MKRRCHRGGTWLRQGATRFLLHQRMYETAHTLKSVFASQSKGAAPNSIRPSHPQGMQLGHLVRKHVPALPTMRCFAQVECREKGHKTISISNISSQKIHIIPAGLAQDVDGTWMSLSRARKHKREQQRHAGIPARVGRRRLLHERRYNSLKKLGCMNEAMSHETYHQHDPHTRSRMRTRLAPSAMNPCVHVLVETHADRACECR